MRKTGGPFDRKSFTDPIRIRIKVESFEEASARYQNYFDVAISNIPFGNFYALDPNYLNSKDPIKRDCCRQIHNYFFVKTTELLHHNGLLCFITSSAFLDTPGNKPFREFLMSKTDLITAIRLNCTNMNKKQKLKITI